MPKNQNIRWIILIVAMIMIVTTMNKAPVQSVAELDGKSCTTNADCPCWGTFVLGGVNNTAYGIGTAKCEASHCNVDYCFDVQPVGEWAKDHPWSYLKTHPMFTLLLIAALLLVVFWPKV